MQRRGHGPTVDPRILVGENLAGVATAWHDFDGQRADEPVHLWLRWAHTGWCKLYTPGSGDLAIYAEQPYPSYDMQKHGRIVVDDDAPEAVLAAVGLNLTGVRRLWEAPPGHFIGVVFGFGAYALAAANLGDELCSAAWPSLDSRWLTVNERPY